MQGRRVGTITLGITLVVVGILYLLINFFNLSIDADMIKFWPIILISLGIEVMVFNHFSVKGKYTLKFDIVSIFLVMILLFFSFGLYAFGKFSSEILNPSSPLYFKNHLSCLSYINLMMGLLY